METEGFLARLLSTGLYLWLIATISHASKTPLFATFARDAFALNPASNRIAPLDSSIFSDHRAWLYALRGNMQTEIIHDYESF